MSDIQLTHGEMHTSKGVMKFELYDDDAPLAAANFKRLAEQGYYNGLSFHRVIPEFMIQGGDLLRSGMGGTGYEFGDENVQGHNAPGLLCMANHGPNTNGGQFFITEEAKEHLDGSYSIFGRCTPTDLVNRIARVPRSDNDRPNAPVTIVHVRIRR
jgi:cyclophilin family peptidyl-prolyl cis-trans isomerase